MESLKYTVEGALERGFEQGMEKGHHSRPSRRHSKRLYAGGFEFAQKEVGCHRSCNSYKK